MLRVRIDGGTLTSEALRAVAGHRDRVRPGRRRRHRPAERAAALDPDRGRAGDLAAAGGGRPGHHRGLRRHPAGHPRLPAGRRRRGRGARRHPGAARGARPLHRRPGVLQPAAQVQDRRSPAAPSTAPTTRSTTSRSSACSARTGRPASTCGSAAGCPPTRGSPSGSARSSSRTGSPRCGPGSPRLFRDHGYRRSRQHARLKFLLADWGPERFRQVLEKEFLDAPLPDGPPPAPQVGARGHAGRAPSRWTGGTRSASRCAPAGPAAPS